MLLLVGTSMLIQRFLMGFFWSGIFEMGRNVRSGALRLRPGPARATRSSWPRPGSSSSTGCSTRSSPRARRLLGEQAGPPSRIGDLALYACMVACGVVIHYSALVLAMSLAFWITSSQGVEGSYFTLMEFSRLPREAFKGPGEPDLRVGAAGRRRQQRPARTLLHGFQPSWARALRRDRRLVHARGFVFRRGLRRYTSASS
jgi:ABC-2 type transport system permease protein